MAAYPGTKRDFGVAHQDISDIVYASHMNNVQDEVRAIQDTIGVNPHISTAGGGSTFGAWSGVARTYQTLADRLANIEAGLVADTHSQYARLANTETFTGTKTFAATDTFFGVGTAGTSGNAYLSHGTTGGQAGAFWREGTALRWGLYKLYGGGEFYLRDYVNARGQVTFTPGAGVTAATTTLHSNLTAQGNTTLQGTLGVTGVATFGTTNATTANAARVNSTGTLLGLNDGTISKATGGGFSTSAAFTGPTVTGTNGVFDGAARVYSSINPQPVATPVVIMPFFIGGSVAVGLRRPEFIATVPMTLRGARSRSHAGSGTYQVYVNGASASGAAAAFGTAQALHDFADVNINAGDRVQINVATATADAVDLSVTVDVVTR